jgi:hypothetical protein
MGVLRVTAAFLPVLKGQSDAAITVGARSTAVS